jgi:hypothetical protein
MLNTVRFYFPNLAFRRAATRRLVSIAPPEAAAALWSRTRALRRTLAPQRPRHAPGLNLILRYMEWDCALYLAAREHGLPEEEAGRLVEEVSWEIFGPPMAAVFSATRVRSSERRTRVRLLLDLLFGVLFTSPFRRRAVPSADGVAFDVLACPLADYFAARGVPELTRHAACSLDFRMARLWGVRFERSQTIAAGAPLCDFRFSVPSGREGLPVLPEVAGGAVASAGAAEDSR